MRPRRKKPHRWFRMTHREIARRLGLSHARVQQIERAAIRKMRAALDLELEP